MSELTPPEPRRRAPRRYMGREGPPRTNRKPKSAPLPESVTVGSVIDDVAQKKAEARSRSGRFATPGLYASPGRPEGSGLKAVEGGDGRIEGEAAQRPRWYLPGVKIPMLQVVHDVVADNPNEIRLAIEDGLKDPHPRVRQDALDWLSKYEIGQPKRQEGDEDKPPMIFLTQFPIGHDPLAAQSAARRANRPARQQASLGPPSRSLADGLLPTGTTPAATEDVDDGETERAV